MWARPSHCSALTAVAVAVAAAAALYIYTVFAQYDSSSKKRESRPARVLQIVLTVEPCQNLLQFSASLYIEIPKLVAFSRIIYVCKIIYKVYYVCKKHVFM